MSSGRNARVPSKGPIAHGYLTLSLVGSLSLDVGVVPKDAGAGFNYGLDKVRFLAPVAAGARVRLRVVLDGVEEKGRRAIARRGRAIPWKSRTARSRRLIAEALALVVPAKPRSQEEGA